ncbi:MAG: S41 family peptidase [Gemmatimonadota bacterium]|nr:S41 family peptidase [Gemmatimonadota bacterium]
MKYRKVTVLSLVAFVGFLSGGWFLQGANRSGDEYQRARIFETALQAVARYYVDSIDAGDLYDLATEGMLRMLQDPYTGYLQQASYEELSISTTGDYGGLGMRIDSRDGWIQVVAPIADTPADRAGIASGDQIVEIEGQSTQGWSSNRAAQNMRGPAGTDVSLVVRRAGIRDSLRFTLTRAEIHVNSVEGQMLVTDDIGYLHLTTVSTESAEEVRNSIDQLRSDGARAIILDLRTNPGGIMDQGVALADLFLDRNDLVLETKGRSADANQKYVARIADQWPDMPLAVVVDGSTASAAEILSGALQDHDRAVVVGTPTFGKGVAYLLIPLSRTEAVTVTSARWYTPSGRSIQRGLSGSRVLALRRQSEEEADSVETREYRSFSGRLLDAGNGGIQPDVIVQDTLTEDEQLFAEALGSKIPEYRNVLTRYALELKGQDAVVDPDFEVTQGMLSTILQALRGTGIEMPDSVFRAAEDLVARQFGLELTRYTFGRQAEIRRSTLADEQIQKAMELLNRASTPEQLLAMVETESTQN